MASSDNVRAPAAAGALRNPKIDAAIERAIAIGDPTELVALLERSSGLPSRRGPDLGPSAPQRRANLDLARAVGVAIAERAGHAGGLVRALAARQDEYPRIVAAQAIAAMATQRPSARAALTPLQELAEDTRRVVRDGVAAALRWVVTARGDGAVAELDAWTDGYLQAHVAMEALADRTLLASLGDGSAVVARLDEAFALADASPRADERLQGLRLLRQDLPAQIALFAARFPEVLRWLEEKTSVERPETRDVVMRAISALRKASFPEAEAARLAAALAATAPPPRDPTRVVQGTRKRSKGRR